MVPINSIFNISNLNFFKSFSLGGKGYFFVFGAIFSFVLFLPILCNRMVFIERILWRAAITSNVLKVDFCEILCDTDTIFNPIFNIYILICTLCSASLPFFLVFIFRCLSFSIFLCYMYVYICTDTNGTERFTLGATRRIFGIRCVSERLFVVVWNADFLIVLKKVWEIVYFRVCLLLCEKRRKKNKTNKKMSGYWSERRKHIVTLNVYKAIDSHENELLKHTPTSALFR